MTPLLLLWLFPAFFALIGRVRLDLAVADYADAGGSFSGIPGSGASSLGMSAGGPSG